jgi:hypothetical protein
VNLSIPRSALPSLIASSTSLATPASSSSWEIPSLLRAKRLEGRRGALDAEAK